MYRDLEVCFWQTYVGSRPLADYSFINKAKAQVERDMSIEQVDMKQLVINIYRYHPYI